METTNQHVLTTASPRCDQNRIHNKHNKTETMMCAVIYVCPTCLKTKSNTTTKTHSSHKISRNFSTLSRSKSCLKMFTIALGKLPNILQYITVKTTGDKSSQNIWFGWDGNKSKPRRQDRLNSTCNNSIWDLRQVTLSELPNQLFWRYHNWLSQHTCRLFPYSCHAKAGAVGNTDTLPINTCSPKSRISGQYGHLADHYLLTKKLVASL